MCFVYWCETVMPRVSMSHTSRDERDLSTDERRVLPRIREEARPLGPRLRANIRDTPGGYADVISP